MKYAREIKVGVLAVVCIFLLFFGFNFLKGVNIFSSMYSFHGVYDNIHGLEEQAPVLIRGYKVGQVDKIHYDFTKDSAFIVDVSINCVAVWLSSCNSPLLTQIISASPARHCLPPTSQAWSKISKSTCSHPWKTPSMGSIRWLINLMGSWQTTTWQTP